MSPPRLLAVLLDRPRAAVAVTRAWDRDDAVAVLDTVAPRPVLDAAMAQLRPTDLEDDAGVHHLADGIAPNAAVRAVVFTSGTTGTPKAVELTEAGLAAVGAGCNAALRLEAHDRWLVCLPLHHVAGLAILARARVGGQDVLVHPAFEADAVAAAPGADAVTLVSVVPTMLGDLLDRRAPLEQYRRIVVGGAPFPPSLRARAEAAGAPVVDAYGLSETFGGFLLDGRAIPGAEVRLADDRELLVAGAMVMRGYRLDDDATRDALVDGWLRTGDLAAREPDGALRIVDRRRDLVITGGVNVSPTAVEAVLAEHPAVADVCVAGAPDDRWGERVVAFVVARSDVAPPTVEALRAFGRDRLRAAELPRQVVVVDAIPRSPGGKAQRRRLPLPR